jgi:leucyl aminopeptidase
MHIHFKKSSKKFASILEASETDTTISIGNTTLKKEQIIDLMKKIFTEMDDKKVIIDILPLDDELINTQIKSFFYFNYNNVNYLKHKKQKPTYSLHYTEAHKEKIIHNEIVMNYFNQTRDMIDLPPEMINPESMLEQILLFSKKNGLSVIETYDSFRLTKEGFGGIVTVGKGSEHPSTMAILEYDGTNGTEKPIVLVGKGVTYDSGGYSIKRDPYMKNMKQDKTGALIILGVLGAISKLKLKCRVIAILPMAENVISSSAYKPDEVIISYSGKSVEVFNTDAEGRLLLMDGISLAYKYNPRVIIDIATLTGVTVFCSKMGAIFSNNIEGAWEIQKIGEKQGDLFWVLPIIESVLEETQNNGYTDIKNEGFTCNSSTLNAAAFLKNFVSDDIPWIHMDLGDSRSLYERHNNSNVAKVNSFLTLFYFLSYLSDS